MQSMKSPQSAVILDASVSFSPIFYDKHINNIFTVKIIDGAIEFRNCISKNIMLLVGNEISCPLQGLVEIKIGEISRFTYE